MIDFEALVQERAGAWTAKSKLLNVQVFTFDTWERHFMADAFDDLGLLFLSIVFVSIYSYFVLGSFSPILFRAYTAFVGILCTLISIGAGYALASAMGFKAADLHHIIPFLIVGVGVDDMFVIVYSIDQTPIDMNPNDRFIKGMHHAGPSITIASVTGIVAFLLGSLSTYPALKSFCIFAACCLLSLYFAFLTIFSAWFVYDLKRMHELRGDCCGLCCCKADTAICCKGRFLTEKEKYFVGLTVTPFDENDKKSTADGHVDENFSTRVEKFFVTQFSPKLLTSLGRKLVFVVWSIMTILSVYAIVYVDTNFSMDLFIPEGTYTEGYYMMDLKYF